MYPHTAWSEQKCCVCWPPPSGAGSHYHKNKRVRSAALRLETPKSLLLPIVSANATLLLSTQPAPYAVHLNVICLIAEGAGASQSGGSYALPRCGHVEQNNTQQPNPTKQEGLLARPLPHGTGTRLGAAKQADDHLQQHSTHTSVDKPSVQSAFATTGQKSSGLTQAMHKCHAQCKLSAEHTARESLRGIAYM